MPKIKTGEGRKTAMEKLREVRQKQKEKQNQGKNQGKNLTMKNLEERLEAVEQVLEERR